MRLMPLTYEGINWWEIKKPTNQNPLSFLGFARSVARRVADAAEACLPFVHPAARRRL
jgi:hypothetical protein